MPRKMRWALRCWNRSSATSFVLAGENMGPAKLEKARKLGIDIIDEEEFLEMIGQ